VREGSGNVFADMGLPRAGELLFKADLAIAIVRAIKRLGLSQTQAAEKTGIDQPKVSALMNGDTRGFSVDRLLRTLVMLGESVDIRVRTAKTGRARVRVGV
jgi:predicted XRE-type DNA-binding protein